MRSTHNAQRPTRRVHADTVELQPTPYTRYTYSKSQQLSAVSGKRPSSSTPQPALSPPHCTIEHSDLANAIRYLNSPHESTLRAPVTTDRPAGGLPKAERRARGQKRACSLGAGPAQRLPKPCVDLDRMRRLSHRLSASACAPHTSPHLSPKRAPLISVQSELPSSQSKVSSPHLSPK
jgi:hypothetical protein